MPVPSRPHAEFFAALAPLRERLAAADDALLRTQVAIAQVPAPTGDEGERAALLRQRFEAIGLRDVRVDEAGNVIGRRPGRRAVAPVAVCAHLDTVFSRAVPHVVRCHGVRYEGPSITDNSRGLAVMLAIAEAMGDPSLAPERSVDFVGTTG